MDNVRAEGDKRRVMIRTLLRPWWLNYGGMLQAWALQQVLNDLGYSSAVDTSRSDISTAKLAARYLVKGLVIKLAPSWLVPRRFHRKVVLHAAEAAALDFCRSHIETVRLYSWLRKPRPWVARRFSAFIVGSDQVWRRGMADVPSYLMDFLPKDDSRKRIAYAASFGSDAPAGYDDAYIQHTRTLAKRMTAISVREKSGIDLCASFWGVEAVRLPDPTLLVSNGRYRALGLSDLNLGRTAGGLATYILDPTECTDRVVAHASRVSGQEPVSLLPSIPDSISISAFRANRNIFLRPTAGQWIQGIAAADYIVTDSFHGCVFSIIFERPFLVIPNRVRGFTRFESLLEVFDLRSRMVESEAEAGLLLEPVDWQKVRMVLSEERKRGMDFLASALGSGDSDQLAMTHRTPKRLRRTT